MTDKTKEMIDKLTSIYIRKIELTFEESNKAYMQAWARGEDKETLEKIHDKALVRLERLLRNYESRLLDIKSPDRFSEDDGILEK